MNSFTGNDPNLAARANYSGQVDNTRVWRKAKGQGLLTNALKTGLKDAKGKGLSKATIGKILKSDHVKKWSHEVGRGILAESLRKTADRYSKTKGSGLAKGVGKRLATKTKVDATGTSQTPYRAERINPLSDGLDKEIAHPQEAERFGLMPQAPRSDGTANLPYISGDQFRRPNKTMIGNFSSGIGDLKGGYNQAGSRMIAGYGGV